MTSSSRLPSELVCLVVFWLLTTALPAAQFAGGTGEPNDPYQIATAEQLISIGSDPNLLDKHFVLLNDIDLDPNLSGGQVFTRAVIAPDTDNDRFGFQGESFTGSFDGRGHTITNLVIRGTLSSCVGLFGYVDPPGTIENLRIENARLTVVGSEVGILAGYNAGRLTGCHVGGYVSGGSTPGTLPGVGGIGPDDPANIGGLVGRNLGVIMNCQADMDGVQGYVKVGGLVGWHQSGYIVGCRAACPLVDVQGGTAGGLVGRNDSYVIGSRAVGRVGGGSVSSCGGLVGSNGGSLLNCCAGSHVITTGVGAWVGGLAGHGLGGRIINCYATGNVSTGNNCIYIGGLIGSNHLGYVTNSYAIGRVSAGAYSRSIGGLTGDNDYGTVVASFWDTESSGTGAGAGGRGLSTTQMQRAGTFLEAGWDFVDERANGTADVWQMPQGGGYPVLMLEFDEGDSHRLVGEGTDEAPYRIATPDDLGAVWRYDPFASYRLTCGIDLSGIRWRSAPLGVFNGTFDGNGHIISHFTLYADNAGGLFGVLSSGASIRNLGIADANVMGGDGASHLGPLAGWNCGGEVVGCYATGRLSAGRASWDLGGLVGWNCGLIRDCYAATDVFCGEKSGCVGGLVGTCDWDIKYSYAAGSIRAPDWHATYGGLVGEKSMRSFIIASYFLAPSDGGGPDNSLGIAVTAAQMRQQASFTDWDFEKVWSICDGRDYPRLQWEQVLCEQER